MIPHRLHEPLALLVILVATTAMSFGALHLLPFVTAAERWVADVQVASLNPPEPQNSDIVIVALTEETLEQFPYRSPVDREFLAGVVALLQARGVRAVLLDVLFDQPTEPEKDAALKEILDDFTIPLAVSYAVAEDNLTEAQVEYLDSFLRPEIRGFANIPRDNFAGTVRDIFPGRDMPDGSFLPGVASRLAEQLGASPPRTQTRIAWRGQPNAETEPFPSYPAHLIAALPPAWLKDKIVLIGADLSLTDRHRTPFATVDDGPQGIMAGVKIHAHALSQLLDGRRAPEVGHYGQLLVIALAAAAAMLIAKLHIGDWTKVSLLTAAVAALWVGGLTAFRHGGPLLPLFTPTLAMGLAAWSTDAWLRRQERRQKRFIQTVFSKYVSGDLLEEILRDPSKLSLEAARKELSIIFTDVAGFTTLSEQLEAKALSDLLNRYLELMCVEVFRYGGTVNQFAGDAIYAMFNAPKDQPDHARRALACAIAMDEIGRAFMAEEQAKGVPFGRTRIGVHTALASVGNFGSPDRFEYKALGDAVNTTSRLEGLNKYFGTCICVSAPAAAASPEQPFRPIGHIVLKGKSEPLEVLEPLSAERDQSLYMAAYRRAYALMAEKDPEALAAFQALAAEAPEDGVVAFHIDRLKNGETGVIVVMQEK